MTITPDTLLLDPLALPGLVDTLRATAPPPPGCSPWSWIPP
jgi:hypothetical protein